MLKDIKYFANDMENILKKDIEKRMGRMAKHMVGKVKHNIKKEVYSVYPNPNIYKRTYKLENGVTQKMSIKNNEIISYIYMDDDKIQSYDKYDPRNNLEPYAEIVETGKGYDYDYLYKYNKPREYMRKTYEKNEMFIVNEISKIIKDFTK